MTDFLETNTAPIDIDLLLRDFLADRITPDQLSKIFSGAAPKYQRPTLTTSTINECADWEIRVHVLGQKLSKLYEALLEEVETDPLRALKTANFFCLIASVVPNSTLPAQALFALGYVHWKTGNYSNAIDPLDRAAKQFATKREIDPDAVVREVIALSCLVHALHQNKQLEAALEAARVLEERAESCGNGHLASACRVTGEVLADLGREDQALVSLRRAIELRRHLSQDAASLQSVPALTVFLQSLGKTARRFGKCEEAINSFVEIAELEKHADHTVGYASALSEIGYAYIQAGEQDLGAEYLRDAAQQTPNLDDAVRWRGQADRVVSRQRTADAESGVDLPSDEVQTAEEAYSLSATAEALVTEGRYAEALRAARMVMGWAEKRDPDLQLTAFTIIAKIFSDQNELEQAIAETRKAMVIADKVGAKPAQLILRGNLANALLRQGKAGAAYQVLLDAVIRSLGLLADIEDTEFRQATIAASMPIYEGYASLTSQLGMHEELLRITEVVRARNLRRWIEAAAMIERTRIRSPEHITEVLQELRAVEVELEVRHIEKKIDLPMIHLLQDRRQAARDQIDNWLRNTGASSVTWDSMGLDSSSTQASILDELIKSDMAGIGSIQRQ